MGQYLCTEAAFSGSGMTWKGATTLKRLAKS